MWHILKCFTFYIDFPEAFTIDKNYKNIIYYHFVALHSKKIHKIFLPLISISWILLFALYLCNPIVCSISICCSSIAWHNCAFYPFLLYICEENSTIFFSVMTFRNPLRIIYDDTVNMDSAHYEWKSPILYSGLSFYLASQIAHQSWCSKNCHPDFLKWNSLPDINLSHNVV